MKLINKSYSLSDYMPLLYLLLSYYLQLSFKLLNNWRWQQLVGSGSCRGLYLSWCGVKQLGGRRQSAVGRLLSPHIMFARRLCNGPQNLVNLSLRDDVPLSSGLVPRFSSLQSLAIYWWLEERTLFAFVFSGHGWDSWCILK